MFVSAPAILHIDMDAFFASVEQARRPELRGRPVVVGGEAATRSVVSACSYEARACGVRTAMPITQAERLCPEAVFLPVDMAAYAAVSKRLVALYRQFTDPVEVVSIDEAFLDVTGSRRLFGPPQAIACRIQERVYSEHGLTCSIGIGPTRLLAKLAADLNKPAGIGELGKPTCTGACASCRCASCAASGRSPRSGSPSSASPPSARCRTCLCGCWRPPSAAAPMCSNSSPSAAVCRRCSSAAQLPKSVGREVTFGEDTSDLTLLRATLLSLADDTVAQLRAKGLAARTVTLKVRFSTFHTVTRQATFVRAVSSTRAIYGAVERLLAQIDLGARWVRLVGVSVSGLCGNAFQLTFDDRWKEVALARRSTACAPSTASAPYAWRPVLSCPPKAPPCARLHPLPSAPSGSTTSHSTAASVDGTMSAGPGPMCPVVRRAASRYKATGRGWRRSVKRTGEPG